MSLSLRGGAETATLPQAIAIAWQDDQQLVAILAGITALLAPAAFIGLRLYVLVPLAAGNKPPGFAWCVRALHQAGALEHGRGVHGRRPALAGPPRRAGRDVARTRACSRSAR